MSKKKKNTSVSADLFVNESVNEESSFSCFDLEVDSSDMEEILDKYKIVEKGRFFRGDKEFIVVTVTGTNI